MSKVDQLSDEYFEEHTLQIGRVVLTAAMLDDLISTFISEFLGLEEYQENALLRPMAARAKVDLLQRLTNHYLAKPAAKGMSSLFDAMRKALDDRNALIHGVPTEKDGQIAFVSYGGKNRLVGEPELWPVQRVCELAERFLQLGDAIVDLVDGFRKHKAGDGDVLATPE